jgi:hypothetical protein
LKEWNNLQSNELDIGQTIFVKQPSRSTTPMQKDTSVTTQQPVVTSRQTTTTQPVKNDVPTAKTDTPPVKNDTPPRETVKTNTETIRISEAVKNGDEILEKGIAELIEGTDGNRKYLALHRTAPVGTILKVKNELNNREVFVRVMGKLPDTALTDKVVIKISKSAYDRLGAIDPRFRVEVTYYK